MFLSPMRDDLTVREAGEVDEEPYDMLARNPNHSPDVAVCVHEINSHDHVMTPGMMRTIGSVLSCVLSPSAEKIDTEEQQASTTASTTTRSWELILTCWKTHDHGRGTPLSPACCPI